MMNQLECYISTNYTAIKNRLQKYCKLRGMEWSADVFHSTLLKVLEKRNLSDMTDDGILNYIFMAFKINTLREQQYPYIARRIPMEAPPDRADTDRDDLQARIERDALSDYTASVILQAIEQVFTPAEYNAFRLKQMGGLTYKQLAEKTGYKDGRKAVKRIMEWTSQINRETIRDAFYQGVDSWECAKGIAYLPNDDNQ